MKTTFGSILVALSTAMAANAACSYGGSGSLWNLRVYSDSTCTGAHHLEWYGSHAICQCFDIISPLNDNVHSLVWTSSKAISIYKDAGCKNLMQIRTSSFVLAPVPADLQAMSSFKFCN